ncbi:MAG: hypothetical protein DMG86_02880 [Acidobacteria bacterium]|nr:MAG: hypothetical protein DMG86_02880 [Acidobacteriota bacterium]
MDSESGEWKERRLGHREEAVQFYRDLKVRGVKVCVGMEASGHAHWFEHLLAELQFELHIGDAAEIRSKRVRKQKTDRQDAQRLLTLRVEDRFPRIWVPNGENRDLRQLLWHRRTKECGVRRRCGDRRGEPNCSRWCWRGGPADGGKTCWSYWIN